MSPTVPSQTAADGDVAAWVWHDPARFKRPLPRPRPTLFQRLSTLTKASVQVVFTAGAGQGPNLNPQGTGYGPAWVGWQEMRAARGGSGGPTAPGDDLSGLDDDLSATFGAYFGQSELEEPAFHRLVGHEATLARVIPTLSGPDRQYFAMSHTIAKGILEQVTEDRPPWGGNAD